MKSAERDWKSYNEKLVKRGEFYINPKFLSVWNDEIKEMNFGKEGSPFLYPDSMIEFLAVLHAKSFDYRALQGIVRALSKKFNNFPVVCYTQICRRVNALDISFDVEDNDLVAGVDGSGIKVSNRGDWMRKKWKVRKGWIKVVILGDKEGRIVDVRIGNEELNEKKSARGMVRKKSKKIKKLLGDGLHDCKETFNLCNKLGIDPVIKIRANASEKARGSSLRREKVKEYNELGHNTWVEKNQYGIRWLCTEGIFSAVKRIFRECVSATKKRNMYHEAKLKFWAYNLLLSNC